MKTGILLATGTCHPELRPRLGGRHPINVKSGLWEINRTVEIKSGMSAAEKEAREEAKKSGGVLPGVMAALDKPMVSKECLAQGEIDNMAYPQHQYQMATNHCKEVKGKATSTTREFRYDCPNSGTPISFAFLFSAPNPETWTRSEGSVGVDVFRDQHEAASSGSQRIIVTKTSGKWLGQACGQYQRD